jgi:hypothetical protein
MFKTFKEKIALSGIAVLMIGVALLIFTFISAYGFLIQSLSIMASEDLVKTFGDAFAPLIATCIRIMYLGVMGWVGSLLTIRGVTIIAHAPQITPTVQSKEVLSEHKTQPQWTKAEKSKAEPEMRLISPEEKPQKNDSPQR